MPYRENELMPVCADCNEFATGHCARCTRPLCEQHATREDMRCVECETDFMRRLASTKTKTSLSALLVTIVSGLVLVAAAPNLFRSVTYPAIVNLLLLLPFGAWGMRALMPAKTRRSFLKERVSPKVLGAAPSPKLLEGPAADDTEDS